MSMVAICNISTKVNSFSLISRDYFIEYFTIPYSSYLPVDGKNNEIKSKKHKMELFVGRCCTLCVAQQLIQSELLQVSSGSTSK